jgi:hypothetical protein
MAPAKPPKSLCSSGVEPGILKLRIQLTKGARKAYFCATVIAQQHRVDSKNGRLSDTSNSAESRLIVLGCHIIPRTAHVVEDDVDLSRQTTN